MSHEWPWGHCGIMHGDREIPLWKSCIVARYMSLDLAISPIAKLISDNKKIYRLHFLTKYQPLQSFEIGALDYLIQETNDKVKACKKL